METAVVLSGQTAGLGVIRALGYQDVPVVVGYNDPGDMGRKSKYVTRSKCLPHPEKEEQAYIQQLLDDSTAASGSLIIPASDATLAVVSRNKYLLAQKYCVAAPDWEITEQFLDKKHTARIAERAGVPAPKTFLPRSLQDIEAWAPNLQYPCLAKPSQGHRYHALFNKKMTMVDTTPELIQAYRETEGTGIDLMIQEFIPGGDYMGANYNAYYWNGEPLLEFTAHKVRSAPPTTGSPSVLVSQWMPQVVEQGRKLLRSVQFSGFACTEFKQDLRDGAYKLMEVNVRHNMSSLLAVSCGLNFPWLQYRHLMLGEKPQPQSYQTGKYWIDISRDFGHRAIHLGHEKLSLGQFIYPYLQKHVFAVLDWRDPYPALLRTKDLLISMSKHGLSGF